MATKNDKEMGENFPGYPHYPAKEDIMQPSNNNGMVNSDADDGNENDTSIDGDPEIVMGTEADVTPEDKQLLDATGGYAKLDSVDDDGELLNEAELDVPGSEQDDANEEIGEEDEENNYYSLGDNE